MSSNRNKNIYKYNVSTAEIRLLWTIHKNMSIIPGSSNKIHVKELSRLLIYKNYKNNNNKKKNDISFLLNKNDFMTN